MHGSITIPGFLIFHIFFQFLALFFFSLFFFSSSISNVDTSECDECFIYLKLIASRIFERAEHLYKLSPPSDLLDDSGLSLFAEGLSQHAPIIFCVDTANLYFFVTLVWSLAEIIWSNYVCAIPTTVFCFFDALRHGGGTGMGRKRGDPFPRTKTWSSKYNWSK